MPDDRPTRQPTATEVTTRIRSIATGVRLDAQMAAGGELIEPLTEALDLVADLLDEQHRRLIDLRNHKADATY